MTIITKTEDWVNSLILKDADVDSLTDRLHEIIESTHLLWINTRESPLLREKVVHPLARLMRPYLESIKTKFEMEGIEIPSTPPEVSIHDIVEFYYNLDMDTNVIITLLSFSTYVEHLYSVRTTNNFEGSQPV